MTRLFVFLALAMATRGPAAVELHASETDKSEAKLLPLVFSDDFENGANRWAPTDAAAWKVVPSRHGSAYSLFRQSKYAPPFRSPFNIALVKDVVVDNFVLDADVLSTKPDYGHRDMCLVFGYQDAAHFYYVHLGKKTDDHANQIFIVDGAARLKISTKTSPGTNWDDHWHHVKIVRRVTDGQIDVYFDDLEHKGDCAMLGNLR